MTGDLLHHQSAVDDLERRLRDKDHYHLIDKNVEYTSNGYDGEFDVLTTHDLWAHYYEVKCHDSFKSREKAARQFDRAKKAFPSFHWQFIYVTPEGVRRYRDGVFSRPLFRWEVL